MVGCAVTFRILGAEKYAKRLDSEEAMDEDEEMIYVWVMLLCMAGGFLGLVCCCAAREFRIPVSACRLISATALIPRLH